MRLMRDLVGETFSGRYRLIGRVAGGGMGEVYRGHDLLLDRSVAVKVLQPSLASDPQLVDRFKQEARAVARLTHPNVVAVHDWGAEDDETYYMVMEYVSGTDLRDLLCSRGSLEPAQAAELMASVCDALDAAHATGLVHRDVKPENILIARDGKVKVADFGIAVVADADRTSPGGGIPGTLRYLSPEQAAGHVATAASDVWSAGAVLAEVLTGRPPLLGSGADLLRRRAIETPIPPSAFDTSIPQDLDDVVMRACSVEPRERYQNAGEMASDLRRAAARSLPDAPALDTLMADLTGEVVLPDMHPTMTFSRKDLRRKARRSGRSLVLRLAVLLLAIAVVGFGGYKGIAAVFGPDEVRVPSFYGMQTREAQLRANDMGLLVEVSPQLKHTRAPKGAIIGQVPSGGVVQEGTTVTLYVNAGIPTYAVPSVIELDVLRATRMLKARGLQVGEITKGFSDDPVGVVVAQRPEGGRLRYGSEVHLVVSKGPRPVKLPNVFGLPLEDAQAKLEKLGFTVTVRQAFDAKVELGRVIETLPEPGETLPKGTEIELVVSKGPKLEVFRMPDVRNKSVDQATAQLEAMGLIVTVEDACGGGQTVVDSDPVEGTKVREGDEVALFVC